MIEQLKDMAEARSFLYRSLTGFYLAPPSKEQIEVFRDIDVLTGLSEIFTPDVLEPLERFSHVLEWDYDSLRQEYIQLFIVPSGRYITPYENVYRDRKSQDGKEMMGLLQGHYTVSVKEKYRKAGAEIDRGYKDLPDFVGLEFAFMQFLSEREVNAWNSGHESDALNCLSQEKDFIFEHMIHWVPDLCEKIKVYTTHDFILGMSLLTEAFLGMEKHALESVETM
jgi:TorA maturation chaperone TorD